MKKKWAIFTSFIKKYFQDLIAAFIVFSVAWVILYRFVPPPVTILMINRYITSGGDNLHYSWINYENISPYLKVAAMASEDQNLPFHNGLDLEAIDKAMNVNKSGKKTHGASTITQQVAKNVFLFSQRSYFRKALELYFTLLIELFWPKERVLEMYLNVAEMGNMIFGAESASRAYFKKSAKKLSLNEAAAIIAILPNPRKYSVNNPGPYVSDRKQQIIALFYQLDGTNYLRELYVRSDKSLYDFRKYKK